MSAPEWLIVRPCFDSVTEITFDEAQDIIDYMEEKGVPYLDLAKDDAVREKVEEALKEHPSMGIHHADHGSEDKIWGNDDRPVIDLKNVDLLKDRECYNNNCSSAKKLGVEAWKRGATYWGYTEVFTFTTDALEEFKQFVNFGLKRRLDGFSWKECLEKAKKLATELIDKLIETGRTLAASCMTWDRNHLVCYNAESPQPTCGFRRLAVSVFGRAGWYLTRKFAVALLLFGVSLGIMLHDFAHECWLYGGYSEVFGLHGFYVGFTLAIVAFLMATLEHLRKK